MTERLLAAFLHGMIGGGAALGICLLLRRQPAAIRNWIWRLAMLKAPIALLLTIPVAVLHSPTPRPTPALVETPIVHPSLPSDEPSPDVEAQPQDNSVDSWLVAYITGLITIGIVRVFIRHRLKVSDMPRVQGIFHPRIILPDNLAEPGRSMALRHEQAHIQRHDPVWSLIAEACCLLTWFCPATWLCARAMRVEAELACDATVMDAFRPDAKTYAQLLLTYAGHAPQNALSAPAKRLARRITMLQTPANPLKRPIAVGLLVVVLAGLVPWQAVAAQGEGSGPLKGFGVGVPATAMPLDQAVSLILEEPGVREEIGWTAEQSKAVAASSARWRAVLDAYQYEFVHRKKTQTLKEVFAWDRVARPKAFADADAAAGQSPISNMQIAVLRARALKRFGSALWTDPLVMLRLGLKGNQVTMVQKADSMISEKYQKARGDLRSTHALAKPIPAAVKKQLEEVRAAYLLAPLSERSKLYVKMANLERPYGAVIVEGDQERFKARAAKAVKESWQLRNEATKSLRAQLTEKQRSLLDRLETDPSSWKKDKVAWSLSRNHGLSVALLTSPPFGFSDKDWKAK